MESGIVDELERIDWGDQRLNARSKRILEALAANPRASINASMHGWSESQAAYRFFDNDNVTPEAILEPHRAATLARMAQHEVVIVAQDTTELDFSNHPPLGAGPLNSEQRLGFLDHSQLAITPEGLCLGVVAAQVYARSVDNFRTAKEREHDPIETKESYRWLEGYREARRLAEQAPGTRIISVADSEADIYELLLEAQTSEPTVDFIIRAGRERSLPQRDPTQGPNTYCKFLDEAGKSPRVATRELHLPRTPKREPRTATVEIRARTIELKAPYRKHSKLANVRVNAVLVREVGAPPGVEPIEWLLITSLPIDAPEQVLLIPDYYTKRWPIEVFFRILKTGCRVERIQLEQAPRVLRCLMFYKIVAWRIAYLTILGRTCPKLSCDVLFTADEWKAVWTITRRRPLPKQPPRLDAFLLLVASLGGHNGRKADGPPGPQALWTGIRRMTDFGLAWQTFGPEAKPPPQTCV